MCKFQSLSRPRDRNLYLQTPAFHLLPSVRKSQRFITIERNKGFMANLLCSALLLLLFSFVISSAADLSLSAPQELPSFTIRDNQEVEKARGCSYTVKIKTSCSSPKYTRDAISLAFGDRYRNEVYAPRLDDPSSYTFERCSTDTFTLQGPCGYGVCYLYLYRSGYDGWIPDSIKIYEPSGRAVTFYYGRPIPNGIWYGFDQCNSATLASA